MRLRPLDGADRSAYLHEIRPRFFVLRVDAGRAKLRWWVPAWALEEPLRFGLAVGPLVSRWLPSLARRVPVLDGRLPAFPAVPAAPTPGGESPAPWWHDVDALFSEAHRDLLMLPDGAPLLDVAAGKTRIVIEERRL